MKRFMSIRCLFLAAFFAACFVSCSNPNTEWESDPANDTVVHIRGHIEEFPTDRVRIGLKGDLTNNKGRVAYSIPVKDGFFSADVPLNRERVYELHIPLEKHFSSYRSITFFADRDSVLISLQNDESVVNAGGENAAYYAHRSLRKETFSLEAQAIAAEHDSIGSFYTEEYKCLIEQMEDSSLGTVAMDTLKLLLGQMHRDSTAYTPPAKAYLANLKHLNKVKLDFSKDYLQSRKASLALFAILYESLVQASELDHDYPEWVKYYSDKYANKFLGCNLHQRIAEIISARNIHEGMPFVDFTLPNESGTMQTLSELIGGKPALVQFWGTWCGPCITGRHTIQPLYEQYRDRGVVVVEVAREYKNDRRWRDFIQNNNPGWIELLAMEENHSIWVSYGLTWQAGGMFLIDQDGIIVRIDPTKEEIEAFFKGRFLISDRQ